MQKDFHDRCHGRRLLGSSTDIPSAS